MKLLCLSDDEWLGRQIRQVADQMQWDAICVPDRASMTQTISQFHPDMLLVDVAQAPGLQWWEDGLGLQSRTPTVLFDWEIKEEFMVRALENGADDYILKPFSVPLLVAKLKALIRRQVPSIPKRYFKDLGLMIDSELYVTEAQGKVVPLTMTEFKILRELATAGGKVVRRVALHSRVFGHTEVSNRSLDVHVCSLRKKFKPFGIDIDSVRGVGYRVSPCRI